MITASRVLLVKSNQILFIHRYKFGKEYYVLPGGTIEKGETPEQAAVREVKEETGLDVELDRQLWKLEENFNGEKRYCYFYLAKSFNGRVQLGGPELERQSSDNQYLLGWISVKKIKDLFIYPKGLKEKILNYVQRK